MVPKQDIMVKRFFHVGMITTGICGIIILLLVWLHLVTFDSAKWSQFFNAWLPLAWSNMTIIAVVLLCLEWGSRGHTIGTILYITDQSSSEDKRTAAYFIIGIVYCAVQAGKVVG